MNVACYRETKHLGNCEAEYNDAIIGLILYFLSGFGDNTKMSSHLIIDAREDTIINRLKSWLEDYTEQIVKDESDRNNQRILEVSHFADCQQTEFHLHQLVKQLNINVDDTEVINVLDD